MNDKPLPRYTISGDEGPECPFCGATWTADDPAYYDEKKPIEKQCPSCGNSIRIEVEIDPTWLTYAVAWKPEAPTPPDGGREKEEA